MKRELLCLSALLAVSILATAARAQETAGGREAVAEARMARSAAERAARTNAAPPSAADAAQFEASVNSFRFDTKSEPVPLYTNPGDAQGILLSPNAIYGQQQIAPFGLATGQWLGLGKALFPVGAANAPYGLILNWDSNTAVFNLVDGGPGLKNLVIGFGGNVNSQLRFNFFSSLTGTQTTVGVLTSGGNLDLLGLARLGSETGTSQAPSVGLGYNGLVVRRINTSSTAAGQIVARTDNLRLERDGTSGGLRLVNQTGASFLNLACTGVTSAGAVIGRAFIVPAVANSITSVYSDSQAVVSVDCTFGDAFFFNNITKVHLQRYPGDFFWAGTVTSTFNQ